MVDWKMEGTYISKTKGMDLCVCVCVFVCMCVWSKGFPHSNVRQQLRFALKTAMGPDVKNQVVARTLILSDMGTGH